MLVHMEVPVRVMGRKRMSVNALCFRGVYGRWADSSKDIDPNCDRLQVFGINACFDTT